MAQDKRVFVVVLDREGEGVREEVNERLENRASLVYRVSSTVFMVSEFGLSKDIAEMAGIKGDDRIPDATGAVFRIDSYSGFTDRALWEWLNNVEAS